MRPRKSENGSAIVELVAALCVFTITAGFFYTSIRGIYRMQRTFLMERDAIMVLGNTIERMRASGVTDDVRINKILADEVIRGPLGAVGAVGRCDLVNGTNVLSVVRTDLRLLAQMNISE